MTAKDSRTKPRQRESLVPSGVFGPEEKAPREAGLSVLLPTPLSRRQVRKRGPDTSHRPVRSGGLRFSPTGGKRGLEARTPYIIPSIPPMPPGGIAGPFSFFGFSATVASVVTSNPAIDAAF